MKNLNFKSIGFFFVAALLCLSSNVFAQRGSGGWGQNSTYGRIFNPQTIETLNGSVVAVERIKPNQGMSYGLHLKLKTDSKTFSVHLGPAWYLENQDIQLKKGDVVEVMGSKVTYQNAPAIIAIEVMKDDFKLKLRDMNGFPVWSGWRRKGMGYGRVRM